MGKFSRKQAKNMLNRLENCQKYVNIKYADMQKKIKKGDNYE